MPEVLYEGLRISPSHSAMRELMAEGLTLEDVKEVLENGVPAPRKRKRGVIEKLLSKGSKTYNAVVVLCHNEVLKEDIWLLIHFGRFTRRK